MPGNVIVKPATPGATHDISLTDEYGVEWGLKLDGGPKGVQEIPQAPSSLRLAGGAGGKFGDFEAPFAQLEQRDWQGGRGQDDFSADATRFFDSQAAWTLTDGKLLPAPQWRLAEGFGHVAGNLPGDVAWKKLTSGQRYLDVTIAMTANFTAEGCYAWVRRRGSPGTLTLEVCSDSAGQPDTVLKSATVTTITITDTISVFHLFNWTGTQALSNGTTYHVKLYGASTDNDSNYWEVGCDAATAGLADADDSSYGVVTFSPYFALCTTTGAETPLLEWHFFILRGVLYAYQRNTPRHTAGTLQSSLLYMNGDHGACDSNSGALTTLEDATKSWTNDQWIGAKVRIVDGPGDGEIRTITDNDSNTLTVDPAWTVEHTTSGRYVIYDTPIWSAVGSLPSNFTVTDVAVANNIAFIACGGNPIRQFRNSGGTNEFNTTETATASFLTVQTHPDNGVMLWKANATTPTVQHAAVSAWGGTLTFAPSGAIPIGDTSYRITNGIIYDDQFYVLKEDSLWRIKNDRASQINVGLEAMPESTNGVAAVAQNLFLYFSWAHSVERLYGGTLDDFGPWTGTGLPAGRTGPVSALEPYLSWLIAAIDGGPSGTSSILVWNGRGWHELFRGWEVGRRIRSLKVVPTPEGRPKLYFSFGSLVCYLEFPYATLNPQHDSGFVYQHEHVLVTSTYDMTNARLPKLFKELNVIADNLGEGQEIWVDAQFDDDIGTARWQVLDRLTLSPFAVQPVRRGNVRAARFRLRIQTDDADVPVAVKAVVAEGFARTPVKYQYNLKVIVGKLQRNRVGGAEGDPDDFIAWAKHQARSAALVRMNAVHPALHGKDVIIEPPSIFREAANAFFGLLLGRVTITVREA